MHAERRTDGRTNGLTQCHSNGPLLYGINFAGNNKTYEGGPKNNENLFLEGRMAVLPSAPAWCEYVTALRISWPSGVLEEKSIGSV